jgi:hypothetical protein
MGAISKVLLLRLTKLMGTISKVLRYASFSVCTIRGMMGDVFEGFGYFITLDF